MLSLSQKIAIVISPCVQKNKPGRSGLILLAGTDTCVQWLTWEEQKQIASYPWKNACVESPWIRYIIPYLQHAPWLYESMLQDITWSLNFLKAAPCSGLVKKISNHVFSWAILNLNLPLIHSILHKEIPDVDVSWVSSVRVPPICLHPHRTLFVVGNHVALQLVSLLLQEIRQPNVVW